MRSTKTTRQNMKLTKNNHKTLLGSLYLKAVAEVTVHNISRQKQGLVWIKKNSRKRPSMASSRICCHYQSPMNPPASKRNCAKATSQDIHQPLRIYRLAGIQAQTGKQTARRLQSTQYKYEAWLEHRWSSRRCCRSSGHTHQPGPDKKNPLR